MIAGAFFYGFSFLAVLAAAGVVASRNPVHAVLCLILAFFSVAGLFVLLGAELLAMLLVIVYVGAVAVLFLFVVMMLNINLARMKEGFLRYLPFGAGIGALLFFELFFMLYASVIGLPDPPAAPVSELSNIQAIGAVLYTEYGFLFQLAGLVLLAAMIGAIVLTHRERSGVRRQKAGVQIARNPKESVVLVKVETGAGVG